MATQNVEMEVAGRRFKLETGKLALQADGAVTVQLGETIVLAVAMMAQEGKEDVDFFPLTIEYLERYYAAGKIKGSRFIKREGRPSDEAILRARLIDRPIRPLFPKGITNEVQGMATILSADLENEPGVLAITGMSAAMLMGGLPMAAPLAGVRIGYKDGEFIVFPTMQELAQSKLDLIVAGTEDAIAMVEAGANEVTEEELLKALELAHSVIKKLCELQKELVKKVNPTPRSYTSGKVSEEMVKVVSELISKDDLNTVKCNAVECNSKHEIKATMHDLQEKVLTHFAAKIEDETYKKADLLNALQSLMDENLRANILEKELRIDGRGLSDIRPVSCEVGIIPRTHGSALFQRGETQALTLTTLGAPGDAQIIDTMDVDEEKRYIHYYVFPPYSIGEVKPWRGPSRREIGHGALAERALAPMIPSKDDFPYTIMLVSEIVTCNGSSSMASVCGSTLSLMDAGVPIKKPVSAIAMGLVTSDEFRESGKGAYKILTDIQGFEDFAGDMDFKVAGTSDGITALQMDIKVKGITLQMMGEALERAKVARADILQKMLATLEKPRAQLSKYAPLILKIQIKPEQIREVIGKGGETIQKITKECEVQMDIDDSGLVIITAPSQEAGQKALTWVKNITYEPTVGEEFEGTVVSIQDFGAFVEFVPGKDGLVHISKLRPWRVNKVEDVLKMGDKVKVRLVEIDEQHRYNLSMQEYFKDATPPPGAQPAGPMKPRPAGRPSGKPPRRE